MTAGLLVGLLACTEEPTAPGEPAPVALVAFAASSLTDVLPDVAAAWGAQSGHRVTFSFESSSKLAKQIESGQPADLFFSADTAWMDAIAGKQLVHDGSRVNLLGNTLVVVLPAAASFTPASAAALGGPGLLHLAMAGENVPAGKYGRASLQALGAWDGIEARVVSGDNVRTALGWVAGGEAEAGIVYATDARAEPRVKVAFAFPADSHPPIVYPAAVLAGSQHPTEARSFLDFCAGEQGRALFAAAGFSVLPPP